MPQLSDNFDRAYLLTAEEVLQSLRVRRDMGLAKNEVAKRQKQFGQNIYLLHARPPWFWQSNRTSIMALRNQREQSVSTENLVPGDIIMVGPGDIVPADARLLTCAELYVQENILTGQPMPIRKHFHSFHHRRALMNRHNMIYAGTKVKSGNGVAAVTAIGRHTEYAKITNKIDTVCTDIFTTLVSPLPTIQHFDWLQGDVLTPSTSLGDKEQLALAALALTYPHSQYFIEQCGLVLPTFSRQWRNRDRLTINTSADYQGYLADHPTKAGQTLLVTGSPEELLQRSHEALTSNGHYEKISTERRLQLEDYLTNLAKQGFSLLAVAMKRNIKANELTEALFHNLSFMGVYVMKYTLIPSVKASSSVIFLTAEHPLTVKYLADKVGITITSDMIATGEQLRQATDKEITKILPHIRLWAHLQPLDKQRIVRLLQK